MFDIEKYAVELRKDPSYRTIFRLMAMYGEGDVMEMYTGEGVVRLHILNFSD